MIEECIVFVICFSKFYKNNNKEQPKEKGFFTHELVPTVIKDTEIKLECECLSSFWNAYWSLYTCIRLSKPHQHDVYLIVSGIKVTFPHKKDVLKQSYTADSAIAIHMHWCHSATSSGIIFLGYKNTQRNRENNRGFEIKWTINRGKSVFFLFLG